MNPRRRVALVAATTSFVIALIAPMTAVGTPPGAGSGVALMRLNLVGPPGEVTLPVHAVLQDAGGVDYVLVLAPAESGLALGAAVVDAHAADTGYLVALERRPGAREAAATAIPVLLDDGRHIVVRDGNAVVSPMWSIHSGVGTSAYAFCWGMGGENQAFDDMDHIGVDDLK